jgi:hypothetical protein
VVDTRSVGIAISLPGSARATPGARVEQQGDRCPATAAGWNRSHTAGTGARGIAEGHTEWFRGGPGAMHCGVRSAVRCDREGQGQGGFDASRGGKGAGGNWRYPDGEQVARGLARSRGVARRGGLPGNSRGAHACRRAIVGCLLRARSPGGNLAVDWRQLARAYPGPACRRTAGCISHCRRTRRSRPQGRSVPRKRHEEADPGSRAGRCQCGRSTAGS